MDETSSLTDWFEANRRRLRGVAFRMLGSISDADDAIQEAWLRLSRSDTQAVENPGGWLTTVVARVCLDMLRVRRARREEVLDVQAVETIDLPTVQVDPEQEAVLADSVGLALMVVLQTLGPAERVAFVLHDMFDLPFEDIGGIVGRSPAAARQLASRARRRVRGQSALEEDLSSQRALIEAFLAAARANDMQGLLAVLDPDVVLRADEAAMQRGGPPETRGAQSVAKLFAGRAQIAQPALLDGILGAAVAARGRLLGVLDITVAAGRIVAIDAVADPARLRRLTVAVLPERSNTVGGLRGA